MKSNSILRAGLVLTLFAISGAALVVLSKYHTAARIEDNRRAFLLRSLHSILPPGQYDNDLLHDTVEIHDPTRLGSAQPVTVYRARHSGQLYAVAFMAVAPDGYSGAIKLLVGITDNGVLTGVRVLEHRETPGLGDAIEAERSDWMMTFNGLSLEQIPAPLWQVKRDGGMFDQFSGATITPRAVVKAVHQSLEFFQANRAQLFALNVPE
jgi:Na+-translocating ferredoxin:NAD+ oxidoreductase subunit G